ncbi:hypothetical protein G6F43_002277 [Rhizopus delemar]|nr:hypothetical protein G6F43_002277 [Rhizopus delemar]
MSSKEKRLILNAVGLYSNIYALKNVNSPLFQNPYAVGFGGQYQYLTIIGLVTATIAFGLKLLRYVMPNFSAFIYTIVTNIATPLEGLISVLYWSMILIDPRLLIPDELPRIPLILDFSLHLFPAVFLWIDFLMFDIEFVRSKAHIILIAVFTLCYFVWSWYCQSVNGYWPYPFLGEFTFWMRAGFFISSGMLCWGISPNNTQQQGIAEKEEIWSTILSNVASSRMVPTKRILVLGDSASGKSSLIHFLKNDPGPQAIQADSDDVPSTSFGVNNNYVPLPVENLDDDTTSTLALGYNVIDVQDEENEAVARLGVYQLGLSAAEYLPLLKFALGTDTLADSAVIIVLDWTRPWTFLESLQRWIHVLQHRIDEICKDGTVGESWSKGKTIVDELREKVEHYLQTYTEPAAANPINMTASTSTGSVPSTPNTATNTNFPNTTATSLVTTTTSADQVTLPLSQGTLTNNLGIPIIIVCCKSDAMDMLDQTMDYKDEHFDFIQQMLRCICMKYGAALFYTSTRQPYTFHNLRQYLLHRLLTTTTKAYPFNMKAQVIERDVALVPSGWDSWGKLRVLREGFDCEAVNDGWDADMDAVTDKQQPGAHGSRGIYEEVISDPSLKDQPLNTIPPPVTCEEEQAFLDRHYETLKHVSDIPSRKGTGATTRPGVVGPIGVSSTDIELVRSEGNKLRDSGMDKSIKLSTSTSSSTSAAGSGTNMGLPSVTTTSSASPSTAASSLPPIDTGNGTGQPGGPSHEVLANFFQSLLSKKASSGGSSPTSILGARDSETVTSSTTAATSSRRPTISRKDAHKELDRMRQFVNKP